MPHTQDWDTSYEAIPANTDNANEGAQRIRNLKRDIRERMEIDHYWKATNSATDDGMHKKVTLYQQDSEPSNAASKCILYGYNGATACRPAWMDENGVTGAAFINAGSGAVVGADGVIHVDGVQAGGTNSPELKVKVIELGDWDMDATATLNVAHGLTLANIRFYQALIRNDADSQYSPFHNDTRGVTLVDATNIALTRTTGGYFDGANFDSTSYNRGWVTIWYVA